MDTPLLLSVDEAARRLRIGRSHTYQLVLSGELASIKIGKSRRVPARAVEDFIEKLRSEQSG